jgi:hypothetical protein
VGTKALIYVQPGSVSAFKQTKLCLGYAMARGWSFAIVPAGAWRQAVRLISEGQADVLLMATHENEATDEIVRAVEDAHGEVVFCRPPREHKRRSGHNTDEIISLMLARGGTVAEIVRLLDVPVQRVREILRRRPLR